MAPLAEHLVGYLSMFLQLGVLALVAVLAVLVRISLGRRPFDAWTAGLTASDWRKKDANSNSSECRRSTRICARPR